MYYVFIMALFCRFSGAKRFSIEGGESLIPGLNELLQSANELGVETVFMGMAHRGWLCFYGLLITLRYCFLFFRTSECDCKCTAATAPIHHVSISTVFT